MTAMLKLICALLAGIGTAVAVASCGSAAGLIPAGNAGPLQSDFDAVAQAVAAGDCTAASQAVAKAQQDLGNLPSTVDAKLRADLTQGVQRLANTAGTQCHQQTQTTTTTTTTPTTTATTTTPTTTATTPTTTTTTTTPTTTTPTTTTSKPPLDNGGGTPAPGNAPTGGSGQ